MIVDGIEQLDAAAAAKHVAEGAVMLDVRQAEERSQARIPGDVWIPLGHLQDRYAELPDRPIVVYCASGLRSHQAAHFLKARGYDAVNLMHGITGWYRMGQPVETG